MDALLKESLSFRCSTIEELKSKFSDHAFRQRLREAYDKALETGEYSPRSEEDNAAVLYAEFIGIREKTLL